jgi:hypothetical protein
MGVAIIKDLRLAASSGYCRTSGFDAALSTLSPDALAAYRSLLLLVQL